ncbi:MAG: Asr1405/Asl0597 family protein [Coleofasciculaceae cyanobacterium]
MNPSSYKPDDSGQIVEICWSERWQVYRRLQELSIPCQCRTNQPLVAQIEDVTAAIQLWSVVRQVTLRRCEQASWIERCWHVAN